jgi:hypothetical protein
MRTCCAEERLVETHWAKRRHVGVKRELQMRIGPVWVEIRMMTNFEMEKGIR